MASGGYDPDRMVQKLIGIVVFAVLFAALVPTTLSAFSNISATGIILSSVVATIGAILLGVFALKGVLSYLK